MKLNRPNRRSKSECNPQAKLTFGVDLHYGPLSINELRNEMSHAGIEKMRPRISTRGILDDDYLRDLEDIILDPEGSRSFQDASSYSKRKLRETYSPRKEILEDLNYFYGHLPNGANSLTCDARGPRSVALADPRNLRPPKKVVPHCGDPDCDGVCMDMECWGSAPAGPLEMARQNPPAMPPDRMIIEEKLLHPGWFLLWFVIAAIFIARFFIGV